MALVNRDYMELIKNGKGDKQKIAAGSWDEIKTQTVPRSTEMKLVLYNRGQRVDVASGRWRTIWEKMEGGIKKAANADASPHVILLCGLICWAVAAGMLMPFM